ncbi:MAG: GNAT family N-acetyltransferase [Sphingomicrobium sp.]|nr:GNAT family N-acetyltransferase [Sphingomonas sp.]
MITTDRLLLRRWREADRAPFAAMGSDPEVMQHFPALLSREESDAMIDERINPHFELHGYGLWAIERRSDGVFIGFTGLAEVGFHCPIGDDVEIGWRLAREAWGLGYAFEAATAVMSYGFSVLRLPRIVAMTVEANRRSRRLMERLAMKRAPQLDFEHPRVPENSPVKPQIVYMRISDT